MQEKYSAEELLKKYREGTCTEQEKAILESWHLHDLTESDFEPSAQSISRTYAKGRKAILAHIYSDRPIRKLWPRMSVAASILLFVGITTYFLSTRHPSSNSSTEYLSDIPPGGNRAILTLSNGQQINLNTAKNGKLALQGIVSINKSASGNLIYQANLEQAGNTGEVQYNTMSTPIGGQYLLVLQDGTKVWLNAASSIKFPTAFTGQERKVEVTGEAYFEVAHNAAKPFRVISSKQIVEVLGTHFNINAYADEAGIRTTLLEGSVKVSTGLDNIVIKPGEQSVFQDGFLGVTKHADIDEAVAWKNGYFQFNDEKISSVMHKLSRWYNIEVQYSGDTSNEGFSGAISRSKNISQVLNMLERTKAVHFKIEGRRVIVLE